MSSWKESMINRLSNLINRNRSAAKISLVLCSNNHPGCFTHRENGINVLPTINLNLTNPIFFPERASKAGEARLVVTTRDPTSSCPARYPGTSAARIARW